MAFFFRILIEFYNIKGPNIRPCRILITKKLKKKLKPTTSTYIDAFLLITRDGPNIKFSGYPVKTGYCMWYQAGYRILL